MSFRHVFPSVLVAAPLAVLVTSAHGSATFFTNKGAFSAQVNSVGKSSKGIEGFEYATVAQSGKFPFPNPLQNGTPAPGLPGGINSTNLIIQTNITPSPCPPTLNPSSNANALWINAAGFLGSNSVKVGTDEFLYNLFSSLDLIFTSHDKTAVSFDMSTYTGFNNGHAGYIVCAYDTANNIIGTTTVPGPTATLPSETFMGVYSTVPIGRVNIWGIFSVPQPFAVDNIAMFVPAPSSAALLALGGAMISRRRR